MDETTNQLTEQEQKEKLILELSYTISELSIATIDEKKIKEVLKNLKSLENELQNIFKIDIDTKMKKDYSILKNSNFDKNFLKLAKFLK